MVFGLDIKTVELYFKKQKSGIDIIDITRQVEHSIVDSRINNGIATVFSGSANASITTMEYEPGTVKDLNATLKRVAPNGMGNGYSAKNGKHDIRSALVGRSITIPFKDNRMTLGKWQEIVLVDFDRKKDKKKVVLQIMGE